MAFTGEAGDLIWVSLVTTGGSSFTAAASLLAPNGTTVATDIVSNREIRLSMKRTYTLRVGERFSRGTAGSYTLRLDCLLSG